MRGVRWLGPSARVVSFSSEKTQHGYRNTLLITDVRSRASLPFREVGPEAAPMLGIRASPSGRYLLILLRGAPSEIWAVRLSISYQFLYLPLLEGVLTFTLHNVRPPGTLGLCLWLCANTSTSLRFHMYEAYDQCML